MKLIFVSLFSALATVTSAQTDTTIYGYVDSTTFRQVEVTSVFVGGETTWKRYLEKYLEYPEDAKAKQIQGTVIVEFTVHTDRRISDVKIVQSVYPSIDKEAIRLITKDATKNWSPWLPAIQNGHAVAYRHRQSITFQLQ